MPRFLLVLMLLVVLGIAFPRTASAFPPDLEWRTIETEHFRITYHKGLEHMGHRLARLAEATYDQLVPLLEYAPNFKTEIVIADHVDTPNGFVNVYPYSQMSLYGIPPDRRSVLNDYDDWMRVLFTHEMVHVVQLDTKSGLPLAVNMIFGGLLHPNQYMPRWYTEGMAVWEESHVTSGGRQRSGMFEMFLRVDALEGNFREIDQINDSSRDWPHGHLPYLYGSKFMQYLADKYGNKTYAALGYLYGERLIPYALNTVLEKVADDNYVRLYDEWKSQLIARYREEEKRLQTMGLSDVHYITEKGENQDSPKMFPTGDRVLFYQDDATPTGSGWAILDMESMEHEIAFEADQNGGADVSPDGRWIVTGQIAYSHPDYAYHDLYLHNLETKQSRQLTFNKRAREPSFAPDGKHLAFVQYTPGEAQLMMLDIDSGDTWEPFPSSSFDQVFTPAFSPDGRYIAFTGWRFGDFKDIYLFDRRENRLARITNDRALDDSPSWSWDGRYLYWSSDRTGIFNAYAYDMANGMVTQLTNVTGGVFAPLPTPDGKRLIVSSYRSSGFDLAYINIDTFAQYQAPGVPELRPYQKIDEPEIPYTEKDYSPFPSVYPKHWRPSMGEDHAGTTLGFTTWGDDISGEHSWSAEVDVGVISGAPTVAVGYANRSFLPNLSLRAGHTSYTLVDAAVDEYGLPMDQNESRTNGSFSLSFPFSGREVYGAYSDGYSHRISLTTSFSYTRNLNSMSFEPTTLPPRFLETGLITSMAINWSYQSRRGSPGFVSSSQGRSFYVSVRGDTKLLGSDSNSISAVAGYNEYIPMPYLDGHSLALKFSGGIGANDYLQRQVFFLGGPPERDFVSDLVRKNRAFGDYVRGYDPLSISGNKFWLTKAEYRFVFWDIERGVYTLPLYFRRMHAAPFFDTAYAWSDAFSISDTKLGVGAEVRLDIVVGYQELITMRLGYQYGINEKGKSSLFLGLDNVF